MSRLLPPTIPRPSDCQSSQSLRYSTAASESESSEVWFNGESPTQSDFSDLQTNLMAKRGSSDAPRIEVDSSPERDRDRKAKQSLVNAKVEMNKSPLACLIAFWDWYLRKLDEEPLKTKGLTAGFLGMVSEALSRRLAQRPVLSDKGAYVRQLLLGLFYRAPLLHLWLSVLGRLFKDWEQRSLKTVLAKIAIHEGFYDPLYTVSYMYLLGRLDGRTHRRQLEQIQINFLPALRGQYRVWPMVQFLNFMLVPPRLSVGFVHAVAVFMNALITWRAKSR
eukprot:TRINITY_DN81277_c0_g1_i1.p1 TRINITY_DN81277_c0_g1~~TRINITY_DN81277_c0_g1_i1.p1  ORF type:complete len:277 (+),score=16.96 TRINITY_DN81277_c0_g1_i1:33-863(+)